ncbi:MAG: hypothetical protein ACXWZ2_06070, partial [Mycobacterium sp.]
VAIHPRETLLPEPQQPLGRKPLLQATLGRQRSRTVGVPALEKPVRLRGVLEGIALADGENDDTLRDGVEEFAAGPRELLAGPVEMATQLLGRRLTGKCDYR